MTHILQEHYQELIALTQLYLFQQHPLEEKLLAGQAEYQYFREWAIRVKSSAAAPPAPQPPSPVQKPAPAPVQKPTTMPITPASTGSTSSNSADQDHANGQKMTEKMDKPERRLPAASSKPAAEEKPKNPASFLLEPLAAPKQLDFHELKKFITEHLPQIALLDQIPEDGEAQAAAAKWKQPARSPQVLLLAFDDAPKQAVFFANICKALEAHQICCTMANASLMEQNQEWEAILRSPALKLVMACRYQTQKLPQLMQHYREELKEARAYFGKVPALLIPDASVYFQEPPLKLSLWKALRQFV